MKKVLVLSAMMLTAVVGLANASSERVQSDACISFAEYEMSRANPKDIKTVIVTTQPQMHCESCENKIKGNLRFEKGVKTIECNIPAQRVTITYDADKTNSESIIKSFEKFGYKAEQVKDEEKKPENSPKKTEK
jgi:copper chaperone CopZ